MKDANAELAKLAKDTPEFLTAKEAVTKMEEVFRAAKAAYDALTKKKNAQDAADEAETQRKARETADATAEAGQKALEKAIEDAGNAITAAESAKTKAQSAVDAFDTDAMTTAKTAYDSCADITNETCDAAKEVCTGDRCDGYRGTLAVTTSGKTCQAWGAQTPQEHTNTPEAAPDNGLAGNNYCRNPAVSGTDKEDTAWCYTTDVNTRFEACGVESQTCDPAQIKDPSCAGNYETLKTQKDTLDATLTTATAAFTTAQTVPAGLNTKLTDYIAA